MIVPMKKLTILCLGGDRDTTLEQLRELGAVHVTDVQPPSGPELDELRVKLGAATKALDELRVARAAAAKAGGKKRGRGTPQAAEVAPPASPEAQAPQNGADAVELVTATVRRRREAFDRADAARRELARLSGFGDVDPEQLRELAARGIWVRLGLAPAKSSPIAPEGFVLHRFASDQEGVRFAVVGLREFTLDELDLGAPFMEVRPPDYATATLRRTIDEAERQAESSAAQLLAVADGSYDAVCGHVDDLTDADRFAAVRAGMGRESVIRYLEGYVPAESVPRLSELATGRGWGLLIADPEPGDEVPTMLRYSRAVRPIRGVLDFLKIYPGYWEADIGWTFLIFFSIFFAMLAGDAVYGAFLLLCTAVLHLKFRGRVPGYLFGLAYITSSLTLVWGVVTGSYVGIQDLPEFLEALRVPWLTDRENVIALCFFIGAVHLTIAHIWNAITVRPRSKALAQIGWIMIVWTMLFLSRTMVLGYSLPSYMLYVFAVGAVLVAAFMATPSELKKSFIDHALLPLTIISSFVDVLSYVRLFAVGFATVAVVSAFNMMATQIGFDSVPRAIGAVFVIAIANALNLVLIALAVLVHAVRLNTLEFSTHKGITWQGQLYAPFARTRPLPPDPAHQT
jgi:V/A-type H+-transporting ATPase subunit I